MKTKLTLQEKLRDLRDERKLTLTALSEQTGIPTATLQRLEASVSKQDFELVQRLSRLDTRTSPDGDSVYPFSGMLVCGSCGSRMTRATRKSGGRTYYYYLCPTTKKRGCKSEGMIKESELMGVVLENIKRKIASVVTLDEILRAIDARSAGQRIADGLRVQLDENERRLEQIRRFKSGLYENMVSGVISKDEYKALKARYTADAEPLEAANTKLEREIEDALACKTERLLWLEHFKQFENIDTINRKVVSILIKSIRILGKREIAIDYNYQAEYEAAAQISGAAAIGKGAV
jgi:hypothetical protein